MTARIAPISEDDRRDGEDRTDLIGCEVEAERHDQGDHCLDEGEDHRGLTAPDRARLVVHRSSPWIGSFATAAARAAAASIELVDQVAALQAAWRERAGRPRTGSAASKVIALLPALPVLSAPTARAAIGVSQQQTLAALKALAEAGVIRQLSAGTYDRQYAATELFDLLTAYEEGGFVGSIPSSVLGQAGDGQGRSRAAKRPAQ